MNEQIFDNIPYDLLSIVNKQNKQNKQNNDNEFIKQHIKKSHQYKGWTSLPKVFNKLNIVTDIINICNSVT